MKTTISHSQAATAINLKRLLASQDARADGQTIAPDARRTRLPAIRGLFTVLGRLTATESSTGS